MGLQDLQAFIEGHCAEACRPVDLAHQSSRQGGRRGAGPRGGLRVVVDAESSIDRLYGGFYPDWVCGGQWNGMTGFLNNLMHTCCVANLEMVVMVNGALEKDRLQYQWQHEQQAIRKNSSQVFRHLNHKATPPPKIWWVPPACLATTLRMALRAMNIPMVVSLDDHHQEIMAYCRENNFHGVLAENADFAIFDPPRYFSSHSLKLTFRGTLETREYIMDEVAKAIDLHPKRFCVLAALLGTHLLPVSDLQEFYCRLCNRSIPSEMAKVHPTEVVRAVIMYVRSIESIDDLDEVGRKVFEKCLGNVDDKVARFKQTVQYYMNGTKEHFNKFLSRKRIGKQAQSTKSQPGSYPVKGGKKNSPANNSKSKESRESKEVLKVDEQEKLPSSSDEAVNSSMEEASETSELKADKVYTDADSGYCQRGTSPAPEITVDPPSSGEPEAEDELMLAIAEEMKSVVIYPEPEEAIDLAALGTPVQEESSPKAEENKHKTAKNAKKENRDRKRSKKNENSRGLSVPPGVMQITYDRHSRGLLHPWIYQLFSQGEIKIGACLEEDARGVDLPSGVDLFRPMRQHVYAILFDLSKQLAEYKRRNLQKVDKGEKRMEKPRVCIREWTCPRGGGPPQDQNVVAEPVDWLVSGIQRLWLGATLDDKNRRLRSFLSCLHCDLSSSNNLLLNTAFVPQHLLLMCCVLRYILQYRPVRVLRRHELDAFLVTAVSPQLQDPDALQDMKLPLITARGVHLASLFMQGIDHASFVNDAVGAPIPWNSCCPWLFFDGKLFHFKLLKASNSIPLLDLCDGHPDQVMRVERLRQAICQGISRDHFAKPSLMGLAAGSGHSNEPYAAYDFVPAGMQRQAPHHSGFSAAGRGRGRGGLMGQNPMDGQGGQLQIAGVVVGNWGGTKAVPPLMPDEMPRGRGRGTHFAPGMLPPNSRQPMRNRVVSSRARGAGHRGNSRPQVGMGRGSIRSDHMPSPGRGRNRQRGDGPMRPGSGHNYQQPRRSHGRGCTLKRPDEPSTSDNPVVSPSAEETPNVPDLETTSAPSAAILDAPPIDIPSSVVMTSANLVQNGFHNTEL